MIPDLPDNIDSIKGFLSADEAAALYNRALEVSGQGPVLEIGSYCGKSTIYLGLACRRTGSTVFALDHHRGSEEHQLGECFHDPDLYDRSEGVMDTFRDFRQNISGIDPAVDLPDVVSNQHTLAVDFPDQMQEITAFPSQKNRISDGKLVERH